jgi:hypothetical protein
MSDDKLAALEKQVTQLCHELGILQDIRDITSLHYKYGYYADKCLYEEVVELFAEDSQVLWRNGVWKGKAGARRLYCDWYGRQFAGGHNFPPHGFLVDHLQMQDIVDVAPDRMSAKARFRCFLQVGTHASNGQARAGGMQQFWESGIYENAYVKEGGLWKVKSHNYNLVWQAAYEQGWARGGELVPPLTKTFPDDPAGPDQLLPNRPAVWPSPSVVPFHYPHPVTGKPWD